MIREREAEWAPEVGRPCFGLAAGFSFAKRYGLIRAARRGLVLGEQHVAQLLGHGRFEAEGGLIIRSLALSFPDPRANCQVRNP